MYLIDIDLFYFAHLSEEDSNWPKPNKVGRQELEIIIGDKHKPFSTSKFGSFAEV